MKRIISLILILILSLSVLAACNGGDTTTTTTNAPTSSYKPEAVRDYVRGLYIDLIDNNKTVKDFTLIAALPMYGAKYTVTWTVDNDAIAVVPSADGLEVTIDVPESVEADINYTLTGTVVAPDGSTASTSFDLVVPAPVVVGGMAELDMMGSTNLVEKTTDTAIFAANGITFTNIKGSSTTDILVNDYAYRVYAKSTVTIEYKGMRKIVITVDDYDGNGKTYMAGFDGMSIEGATITREHDVITIVFDKAVDKFESQPLASQTRIEKIEVYTELDGTEPGNGGNNGGATGDYTAPAANTAFKLFMEAASGTVYFTGAMDSTYLATTTDVAGAADIYFEVVNGGYHIYFMNGDVKTYINAAGYKKSNGYLGCHFELGETPNCVWTYDAEYGILEVVAEFEGLESDTFFAGTYGSYSTVSLSGSYYKPQIATGTQYPARLVLSSEAGNGGSVHTHEFVNGVCGCGEKDPNFVPPVTEGLAIITSPEAGVAYKFGLYHGNESQNVFFNGELFNSYAWYFAYTPVVAEAMDVYLETVEGVAGGYRLYFNNNGEKTYIVAFPREGDTTKGTLKLDTVTPEEYYTFNAEYNTLIYTSVTGEQFYIGSSGTYKSISLSAISYITSATSYISHLYGADNGSQGGTTPAPHEHNFVDGKCECGETDPNYVPPVEGGDDNNDGFMTIPEVLASAEGKVVKFTGTVHSFYEEWSSYNNCSPYIVDENGVKILVFRTTTKVTIGDVVTVEGTVTIYNTTAQIAQGTSTVTIDVPHVCSSWSAATCGKDSACVVCGAAGADKATGEHTYVDGLCSVCGASAASMKLLGTLSFSSTSNRTSWDTSKQIWAANGITVTNNKGASTSNVADYSNPARFYKSSQLIVEATGILKIEFTCNSASYASALQASITAADGGSVSISGSVVTVTFATPVDSYTIASLTGGQVRMNSITVYVAE